MATRRSTVINEQLAKVKERIEEITDNSKDKLLIQMLEDAAAEIFDFTNRSEIIDKLKPLQRDLVLVYYSRLGAEGLSSQSQGGISVSYGTDIPDNLKRRLESYRRLKVSNYANKKS